MAWKVYQLVGKLLSVSETDGLNVQSSSSPCVIINPRILSVSETTGVGQQSMFVHTGNLGDRIIVSD